MKLLVTILTVISIVFSPMTFAYGSNAFVISPPALHNIISNPQLVIVDLRSPQHYETHHIPNAINIPLSHFHRKKGGVDGFIITPKNFQKTMEANGIQNSDHVILYSDQAHLEAARTYWAFDFYGHRHIQILDGGYQAWQESAYPVTQVQPTIEKSNYVVQMQTDKMATKFQTFMASHNTDEYLIIDARPNRQYLGEKALTLRKGHIPKAINIPWYDVIKGRKPEDQYQRTSQTSYIDWEYLKEKINHIPKDKKLILYCNGGEEASILYLGFKALGVETSVYDGSWFEWSDDEKMPITTLSDQ